MSLQKKFWYWDTETGQHLRDCKLYSILLVTLQDLQKVKSTHAISAPQYYFQIFLFFLQLVIVQYNYCTHHHQKPGRLERQKNNCNCERNKHRHPPLQYTSGHKLHNNFLKMFNKSYQHSSSVNTKIHTKSEDNNLLALQTVETERLNNNVMPIISEWMCELIQLQQYNHGPYVPYHHICSISHQNSQMCIHEQSGQFDGT